MGRPYPRPEWSHNLARLISPMIGTQVKFKKYFLKIVVSALVHTGLRVSCLVPEDSDS
jgi:hypothetical protein